MNTKVLIDYKVKENYIINHAVAFMNNNTSYLYNVINGRGIFLETHLMENVINDNIDDNLFFKLVQRRMFNADDNSVCLHDAKPTFFLINMTDSCNLRCIYCFRDVHIKESINISSNELQDICNEIIKYCEDYKINYVSVQPWGGEPLLMFPQIIEIDNIFKASKVSYQIVLSTNATLITRDMAKLLHERDIHVGISLDGNEKLQNLQRPFKDERKNSFLAVYNGIENLRKAGYEDIGIICTISKINIGEIENILNAFVNDLQIHTVKINFVKTNPFSPESNNIAITETTEIEHFYDILIDTIIQINQKGYSFFERNLCDKLINLFGNSTGNICLSRGCLGGDKMITIDRKGNIFPCDLVDIESVKIGNLFSGVSIPDMIEFSREKNPFFRPNATNKCGECYWKIFCEGGCSASTIYNKDKGKRLDCLECNINQVLYPKLLKLALENPEAVRFLTNGAIKIKL